MQFMATDLDMLLADSGANVDLPETGEIQNYTYVSAVTLRNTFYSAAGQQDMALERGFAALREFDLVPEQPTDSDIDHNLRYVRR